MKLHLKRGIFSNWISDFYFRWQKNGGLSQKSEGAKFFILSSTMFLSLLYNNLLCFLWAPFSHYCLANSRTKEEKEQVALCLTGRTRVVGLYFLTQVAAVTKLYS